MATDRPAHPGAVIVARPRRPDPPVAEAITMPGATSTAATAIASAIARSGLIEAMF